MGDHLVRYPKILAHGGEGQMSDPPASLSLEYTDCPLCQFSEHEVVITAEDYYYGVPGSFVVCRCSGCSHMYLNPRPNEQSRPSTYPANYSPHQRIEPADIGTKGSPWYLRFLPLRYIPGLRRFYGWLLKDYGWLSPEFPDSQSATLLELGCSHGTFLSEMQKKGWKVWGIEPDTEAAQLARDSGLSVQTGYLDDCPAADGSFDVVAAWMVLEHVPYPIATLHRMRNLLKDDGQLLLSVPNAGCWEPNVFGRFWYAWDLPRHLHHFTPAAIERILQRIGFTDVRIIHQRNVLYVLGSLGVLLERVPLTQRLGKVLRRYPDHPRLFVQLLLAPLAILLALCKQGGRLSISARKPQQAKSSGPAVKAKLP